MKTIKVHWVKLDNYGKVCSAYMGKDGKLHYPTWVASVWADLTDLHKRNTPGIENHFDASTAGAVYRIGDSLYVCESCSSKTFKPLGDIMRKLADRNPIVGTGPNGAALAKRDQIILACAVPAAYTA